MAATLSGGEVVTNGTTWVEVVAAPSTGQKRVDSVLAKNRDSAQRTLKLRILKGAAPFELGPVVLDAGAASPLLSGCSVVLDANDESLQVQTDATAATTEPFVVPAVLVVTP